MAITAGSEHSCALTSGGAVQCWGHNGYAQLGDGTTTDSSTPVVVGGLGSTVLAITGGTARRSASTSGGAVQCWGGDDKWQLGDGTNTASLTPVAVSGLGSSVVAITASYGHTCALTSGGVVQCWGYNTLANWATARPRDSSTPVVVSGLGSGVLAISAGGLSQLRLDQRRRGAVLGIITPLAN